MSISRRHFLRRGIAFSVGFAGMQRALLARGGGLGMVEGERARGVGYGPLMRDAAGIIDLPEGFTYAIVARRGQAMEGGLRVPGQCDGMAAFPGENGRTILVCNHELEADWRHLGPFGDRNELLGKVDPRKVYDIGHGTRPSLGGCTTLVYDTRTGKLERQFLSLAGTNRNCAGGPTPWGSWLSCEEDDINEGKGGAQERHGYVFEVPARGDGKLVDPAPMRAMGRFYHEAVAVDPGTHIVYETEDRPDGLLYRYLPDNPKNLHEGGKLQALMIADRKSCETGNGPKAPNIPVGERLAARWIDMDDIQSPRDDLRARGFVAGAAKFARGEGAWWGDGCAYFAMTTGGRAMKGQIWKYTPSGEEGKAGEQDAPGTIEIFVEPNDGHLIENADNLTVAPWGDLIACEDAAVEPESEPGNRLVGITPKGEPYVFARNAKSNSELAGVCFAPDGTTMFVNIQGDGLTLAIKGKWAK